MKTIPRFVSVMAIVAAAMLGLTACGSQAAPGASPVLPVETVDLGTVDGTTVNVSVSNKIVLKSESLPQDKWTAKVTDTGIAQFVPGTVAAGAVTNPEIQPVAVGTTRIQLTNAGSGTIVTFAVNVTPSAPGQ